MESLACYDAAAVAAALAPMPITILRNVTTAVLLLFIVALPIVYTPGSDSFRHVKEWAFKLEAILLGALLLLSLVWGDRVLRKDDFRRPALILPLLIVAWTAITLTGAANRELGVVSLTWVAAGAIVFIATYAAARTRGLVLAFAMILPAGANAVLYMLQMRGIWNPFVFPPDTPRDAQNIGFLGNSSMVGMYLLPVAVAFAALALSRVRYRFAAAVLAAFLALALLATASLTAVLAFGAAMAVMALMFAPPKRRLRAAVISVTALIAGLLMVSLTYEPVRNRLLRMSQSAARGNFDAVLTGRSTAFLVAVAMFRDAPLHGVGPGHYAREYYSYKLKVEDRHPSLIDSPTRNLNFREAHNDHLQTLAVAGLPGYALLLASLVVLARRSLLSFRAGDGRRDFARRLAAPLAAAFAVSALGHFPLELAAALSAFLQLAAICCAWTEEEAADAATA